MTSKSASSGFFQGVRLFARGFAVWGRNPRLMLHGIVPGLITAIVFTVILVAVWANLGNVSGWLTRLIIDQDSAGFAVIEVVVALGVIAGSLVVVIFAFTAVTLTIGGPFYERIAHAVDHSYGAQYLELDQPWWQTALISARDSVVLLLGSAAVGITVFLTGLVPVVGTAIGFILGATLGGWFLSAELTAYPLTERGYATLSKRRALPRANRATVVGFGAAAFATFLIPGGALMTMPAAVAGGTLLARYVTGESTTAPAQR